MISCAICFTTDAGYLFPTLVAAQQARKNVAHDKADVIIFSFCENRKINQIFSRICAEQNIQLIEIAREVIGNAPMTLARLFLDRMLSPEYDQILYFDGDIQVVGSLEPLVDEVVPAGHFLAANDPMAFSSPGNLDDPNSFAAHVLDLDLPLRTTASYFNAGVLRISRSGWGEIGTHAWGAYKRRPSGWRFLDQDVLNIVAGERRLPLSLRWNFPTFLRNARVEGLIKPRVLHFMSSPKPWHLVCPPWNKALSRPYREAINQHPELAGFRNPMPPLRQLRYQMQQRYKQLSETITWGYGANHGRLVAYEKSAAVLTVAGG